MLDNSKRIKEIYDEIQRKIFYAIPGRWEEIYLYASIIDRLGNVQTGEMYFYFLPKGLLKRKYINVYEIPTKYDIEEDEYMKAVDGLYDEIKHLREECIKAGKKVWSNLTISIKNSRFKIEYNYDNLIGGKEAYYDHHIYWRNKYLQIEPQGKKEKQAIDKHLKEVEILKSSLVRDNEALQKQEQEIINKAKIEARNILLDAKEDASEILKKMQASSNSKDSNNLRNTLNNKIKEISITSAPSVLIGKPVARTEIKPNLEVFVSNLGQNGIVVSNISKSDEVQVQVGSMKLNVPISNLQVAQKSSKKVIANANYTSISKSRTTKTEINVIGQNVEDAVFVVDKFLDDASLAKLQTVRIVHGKGTGKLRDGIHQFLKKNPHVKSYGEGEMGVTIVELK